eukprot:12901910-Prorocentrum_lima.AAC.1
MHVGKRCGKRAYVSEGEEGNGELMYSDAEGPPNTQKRRTCSERYKATQDALQAGACGSIEAPPSSS